MRLLLGMQIPGPHLKLIEAQELTLVISVGLFPIDVKIICFIDFSLPFEIPK